MTDAGSEEYSYSAGETLREIAVVGDRDLLEEAWLEALEKPGPARLFLETLGFVPLKKRREVSIELLPLVLETYTELGRLEDALLVARHMASLEPGSRPIRRTLLKLFRRIHEKELWLEIFLRSSGLDGDEALDRALAFFDSFGPFKPGVPVEHRAGWGPGVIEGYSDEDTEVRVRFHDGRVREFPLLSMVESLPPMAADDLRAMILSDPEGTREKAERDPGYIVRRAVALYRGPVAAAKIKEAIVEKIVPAVKWAKWWTGAKKAAAQDPWLKVEGGARPRFSLRGSPVSLSEEAVDKVRRATGLKEAVAHVREIVPAVSDPALLESLFEEISRRVGSETGEEDDSELLDGVLLLEEHGRETTVTSVDLFRETSASAGGPAAVRLLASIPGGRGRKKGLRTFIHAFPDEWPILLAGNYHLLARDLMDPAGDALVKAKQAPLLAEKMKKMARDPWKYPWPLFYLARRTASGDLDGVEGAMTAHEAVLVLLRCLEASLFHTRYDRAFVREVTKRYEELLFDEKRGLFERFLDEGEKPLLERAMEMVHVTSKLPKSVIDRLVIAVPIRFPDLGKEEERPFWESDVIFCSRDGIGKRKVEYKELTEVKIPANAEAIGKAASFGDLSENAEWTAAVEEQRLLTDKARIMEEELKSAMLIEEQDLPDGIVAPGTRVSYREELTGQERVVTILGPWDIGDEGVISYRAPLASGLLGKGESDSATLDLPSGEVAVTILRVEPAF